MKSPNIIYIAGAAHSGSSILDVILNNHSKIVGLGEVHRLNLDPHNRKCSCGETLENCKFWSIIIGRVKELKGLDDNWNTQFPLSFYRKNNLVNKFPGLLELQLILGNRKFYEYSFGINSVTHYKSAINNSMFLYDVIGKLYNVDYIVDSTKNPVRLKSLYLANKDNLKIIYLIRDGRAICASYKRRDNWQINKAAKKWRKDIFNLELVLKTVSKDSIFRIKYEDLCDNKEEKIHELCKFLNVEYSSELFNISKGTYHNIPGNPWLLNNNSDHIKIKKDDSWRSVLTSDDIDVFNKLGGRLNKHLGYK